MLRLVVRWWGPLGLVLMVSTAGCSKDQSAGEIPSESTSGGEATPAGGEEVGEVFEETPVIDSGPVDHTSPWGATRAEQCRKTPRKEINRKALSAIEEGVRQAAAGQTAAARTSFEAALGRDSNAYPAAYNLGVLEDRAGQEKKALDQYRQALRILPDYEEAVRGVMTIEFRRGNIDAALAAVEPVAREHKSNLAVQAAYAEALVRARRYEEAWQAARNALKCDERFVPALIALIKASVAQGRDELAESILDQALEVDQRNAELHYLQGERLRSEPGRLRESMTEFRRAVELRPDYAEARIALGIQFLNGGNYKDALSHFEAASNLVPTLAAVHLNLGDAYRANKRWLDAKHAYDRALKIRPQMPEALFGLGLLYMSSAAEFPGLDELTALQKAIDAFTEYRDKMGPRLGRDDRAADYIGDLERQMKRTQRRIEREQRRAKEAEGGSTE